MKKRHQHQRTDVPLIGLLPRNPKPRGYRSARIGTQNRRIIARREWEVDQGNGSVMREFTFHATKGYRSARI